MLTWIWMALAAASEPATDGGFEDTAPLTFSKFVLDTRPLRVVVSDDDTRRFVLHHLRDRGLDVRGAESEVFDIDQARDARFVLGATVSYVHTRLRPQYRELSVTFDWELLDTRTRKVVYSASTVGHHSGTAWPGPYLPASDVRRVMQQAIDKLLQRPAFADAVATGPRPSTARGPVNVQRCPTRRTLPDDLDDLLDAVVTLRRGDEAVRSGVLVSPDGFVLTAAHVVEAGATTARLHSGADVPLTIVTADLENDVALAKVSGRGVPCVPLADRVPLGDDVWAIGTPLTDDLALSVAKGIVSGQRTLEGQDLVQTDAALSPGYSGGPLVDRRGSLVGVVRSKWVSEATEGLGFAVPSRTATERLGITWADTSDRITGATFGPAVRPPTEDWSESPQLRLLDPQLRRRLRRRNQAILGTGLGLVGVGVGVSAFATTAWLANDTKTEAQFNQIRTLDALGGVVAAGGVILATYGAISLRIVDRTSDAPADP